MYFIFVPLLTKYMILDLLSNSSQHHLESYGRFILQHFLICVKYLNKCLQTANKNSTIEKKIAVLFVIDEKENEMTPLWFLQPELCFALYPLSPTKKVREDHVS